MRVRIKLDDIDALFASCTEQTDVLIGIYKLVLPEWDDIESLDGWPSCNSFTWKEICRRFMTFDQKHHPNVLNGGMWMNNGFSAPEASTLPNWIVDLSTCRLTMKGAARETVAVCHQS